MHPLIELFFSLRLVVHTDNVTAAFALRNWGSRRSIQITREVQKVLELCRRQDWSLSVVRIPSVVNVWADGLSRRVPLGGEWSLSPLTARDLFQWAGQPQVSNWMFCVKVCLG